MSTTLTPRILAFGQGKGSLTLASGVRQWAVRAQPEVK